MIYIFSLRINVSCMQKFLYVIQRVKDNCSLNWHLSIFWRFLNINSRVSDEHIKNLLVLRFHGNLNKSFTWLWIKLIDIQSCLLEDFGDFLNITLLNRFDQFLELVHFVLSFLILYKILTKDNLAKIIKETFGSIKIKDY